MFIPFVLLGAVMIPGQAATAADTTKINCVLQSSPHLTIIFMTTNCAWVVTEYSNQGYVITNVAVNTDPGEYTGCNQDCITGWIFMQKDISLFAPSTPSHGNTSTTATITPAAWIFTSHGCNLRHYYSCVKTCWIERFCY